MNASLHDANHALDAAGADVVSSVAESAATDLIKTGVLGSIIVLLGMFAFWVVREWQKTQEARVNDSQKVATTLIDLSNSIQTAIRDLRQSIDALKLATDEERKALAVLDTAVAEANRSLDNEGRVLELLKSMGEEARRSHESIQRAVEDALRRKG